MSHLCFLGDSRSGRTLGQKFFPEDWKFGQEPRCIAVCFCLGVNIVAEVGSNSLSRQNPRVCFQREQGRRGVQRSFGKMSVFCRQFYSPRECVAGYWFVLGNCSETVLWRMPWWKALVWPGLWFKCYWKQFRTFQFI